MKSSGSSRSSQMDSLNYHACIHYNYIRMKKAVSISFIFHFKDLSYGAMILASPYRKNAITSMWISQEMQVIANKAVCVETVFLSRTVMAGRVQWNTQCHYLEQTH